MDEPTILVVDDDAEMRTLLLDVLRQEGYLVEEAASCAEALLRLRTRSFAAILIDKTLPGLGGLSLLPGLRAMSRNTPVILMATYADTAYLDGMQGDAFLCLFKPFGMEKLLSLLRRALSAKERPDVPRLVAGGTP